jgi:hypothetical protein
MSDNNDVVALDEEVVFDDKQQSKLNQLLAAERRRADATIEDMRTQLKATMAEAQEQPKSPGEKAVMEYREGKERTAARLAEISYLFDGSDAPAAQALAKKDIREYRRLSEEYKILKGFKPRPKVQSEPDTSALHPAHDRPRVTHL